MNLGLSGFDKKDRLIFLLGLFTMLKFRLIGTFGVSELIMFYLFFRIDDFQMFHNPWAKKLFFFAILWGVSTFITDIYRDSHFIDGIKGLVSIIFLIIIFPVTYQLVYDKLSRILYYIAGLAISAILGFIFQQSEGLDEAGMDVWQVYALRYMFVFISAWCFYKKKNSLGYLVLMGYGIWSLFHLSRHVFIECSFATVLIYYVSWLSKTNYDDEEAQFAFNHNILAIVLILGLVGYGVRASYEHLASNGSLGIEAQEKYEMQKNSAMGLASGRSDFFLAWEMIKESPIIGYGSYAKDKHEIVYKKAVQFGLEKGNSHDREKIKNKFIPGHSHILGAWVYNGILGLPFWVYSIYLIILFFKYGLYYNRLITPLLIIWSTITLWNILFSPFANRPVIAFFLSSILTVIYSTHYHSATD